MPEVVNVTPLWKTALEEEDNRETMIAVRDVSMMFNIASAQLNSLKEYAIALSRKELRFKEFWALNDISFEVKKGDVFGILGTNGSGKSTLLKIIAGVLEPTKGSVEINGNIAPLIELGAGFDMELTARENIYLNGALLGYSKKFLDQHFDEIVEFSEVGEFLDMPMKNYSSGMVARIAFSIATVIVPEILIVDEVLAVGDFMFRQKCERRISELIKDHGVTVLIVSHSNDQIKRLCNKAIWIEKGHTRLVGTAEEVCRTYQLVGGRTGSGESERLILDALHSSADPEIISSKSISGESRYSSAVKLMEEWVSDENTIILTRGDSPTANIVATGLASALHGVVLTSKADSIPEITAHAILSLNPKRIVLMGDINPEILPQRLSDSISRGEVELVVINEGSLEQSCISAYRFALEKWGDTALLSPIFCVGDALAISPALYNLRVPVFFNTAKGLLDESVSQALLRGRFKRLLVLAGEEGISGTMLEPFVQAGIEIVRYVAKNEYQANVLILDWYVEECFKQDVGAPDKLVVVSSKHPEDAFTVGAYAAHENAPVMLNDPTQLDSVANAIKIIESFGGSIRTLNFVGDEALFSKLDQDLLRRVAASLLE